MLYSISLPALEICPHRSPESGARLTEDEISEGEVAAGRRSVN